MIVTDNRPKFADKALNGWACRRGVKLHFIRPRTRASNGKFRDECLNEHWFTSLDHARDVIEQWRQDYNEVRPHGSLGHIPAGVFARPTEAQLR